MTSYRRFETCQQCNGPVAERQAHPNPIALQVIFGVSFVAFLFLSEKVKALFSYSVWIWSVIQIVLGALLLRARKKAAKKVLVCIKCGTPVPS